VTYLAECYVDLPLCRDDGVQLVNEWLELSVSGTQAEKVRCHAPTLSIGIRPASIDAQLWLACGMQDACV